MENITIDLISVSKTNPRKNFNEMDELTENIKKFGVLQPILVRSICSDKGEEYELVAGERRLRASKAAGLSHIPAIVKDMTDQEALEVQVIENLHRADLHPMEEAEGYERLMRDGGYSAQDLAVKVGKSLAYVYGRMKLLGLSPAVRDAFFKDEITASMALLISRLPDYAAQDQVLEKALPGDNPWEHGMNYKEAVEYIHSNFMLKLMGAPFNPKDAELYPEAGSCLDCQKRTGNQKELFPDVQSNDVCTDPKCFEIKKYNAVSKKIAKAAEKGIKVLQGKEARDARMYNSDYIDLDNRCYDDDQQRTYGELLGKHNIQKVLVVSSDNELTDMYPKVEVMAELAKKYDFAKEALEEENEPEQTPEQIAAEERKRKLAEVEQAVTFDAIIDHAGKKETWDNIDFCRFIALEIANGFNVDQSVVAARHGIPEGDWEELEQIIKKTQTIKELKVIIVELILTMQNDLSELVKMFDIDKKAVKSAAKAKLKEQEANKEGKK